MPDVSDATAIPHQNALIQEGDSKTLSSNAIPISPSWLISGLILAILLTASNGILVVRNRALQRKLQDVMMLNFAPVGATFPTLSGRQPDGTSVSVDLVQSAPLLVLVFEPTCEICDQNWPGWAELTNDAKIGRQCLLISASPQIPPSYLTDHHAGRHSAILGINPEIARSFNLTRTPQTILVEKGKILRTWPGVLSGSELTEVKNGLIKVSEAYR